MRKPGFFIPKNYSSAVEFNNVHPKYTKFIAGGTDLIPHWREKGLPDRLQYVIDISHLRKKTETVSVNTGTVSVEGNTIHSILARDHYLRKEATILSQAAESIGSLQTRNRGTIGGNIVNASPAGDLLAPLIILDASLHLHSERGERVVEITDFLRGPGRVDLYEGEIIKKITWPKLLPGVQSLYLKLGRRNALSIARIGVGLALRIDTKGRVDFCRVALSATFPVAKRLPRVEEYLYGKVIDGEILKHTASLMERELKDIMGNRPSAKYKVPVAGNLVSMALNKLLHNRNNCCQSSIQKAKAPLPLNKSQEEVLVEPNEKMLLKCIVNKQPFTMLVNPNERLIDVLRQELWLNSCKEGCGIGECGSCTIILDGRTVNACLVLAGQVHGSTIVTPEGLNEDPLYNKLQDAFLKQEAVQCGYCTPGMLISCYDLLMHCKNPTPDEVRAAISGNLCRCGSYQQVVNAVMGVVG